jgi:hypothetical protein
MKKAPFIVLSILALVFSTFSSEPEMKSIFNGKNLDGWIVPENNIWWKINDGVMVVENGPEKKGSILRTEKEYSDFVMSIDFKFGSKSVDSGIMVRNDKEQIQIGDSGSLKRDLTCAPYIPGKGYPVEGVGIASLLKKDDWNTMELKAEGNVYTVKLNGKRVLEYPSLTSIDKGPLGLQLHGNKVMKISFKNIKIAELK